MSQPFNPDLHYFLVDEIGYAYTAHAAEFDDGDPENGPGTDGYPPWDEYLSADHRAIIDQDGVVVLCEDRDLALEAWIDEHAGEQP